MRSALAVVVALAAAAAALFPLFLGAATGRLVPDLIPISLAVVAMAIVGAILAVRVPANMVGWLLLVAGLAFGLEFLALAYWDLSIELAAGSWPATVVAAWLYGNLLVVPVIIVVIAIPLVFPTGRLLSPRWRWVVAALLVILAGQILKWFVPGYIADTDVQNPFGIPAVVPLIGLMDGIPLVGAVPFLGAIASVAIRYRRGSQLERQQLKFLLLAVVSAVTAWTIVTLGQAMGIAVLISIGWSTALLTMAALPVAIGLAVLRYRLYEIDRIISRTIAWAMVTGVLISTFTAGVVALQALLLGFTQGATVSVAASTLVVAALFQPLRRVIQRGVDQRFDRRTSDAQRAAESFGERLRSEVALDAVAADLHKTVVGAIRPSLIGLWIRPAHTRRH